MEFKDGRALIIGIANYAEVSPLPAAVLNDANDTADVLRSLGYCGYPDGNVTVLLDQEATLEGIRTALANLASSALPNDTVTIFFSGHGARLGTSEDPICALIPYDCKRSDAVGTTLGESEFSEALAKIKAARLLVIVDACHAGGAATLKSDFDDLVIGGFDEKALQRLAAGTGRVVLASSRATETSIVMNSARNSVFTTAILSGLKGGAPASAESTIKVFELFNFVAEAVRQAVPGRQHPILKVSDLEENFPVALSLGGTKAVASNIPGRTIDTILPDLFPAGPTDQDIWLRAGGDVSRLRLGGTGRSAWFSALRLLSQGGGGADISRESLIAAALEDFPNHLELQAL